MELFIEISIIIVLATIIAAVMRFLKQPLIIGYIITGLIVGPYLFNIVNSTEILESFSQFGIALLLFIVGLHLSPKVIKEVGKSSSLVGLGQVLLTSCLSFIFYRVTGFSVTESLFLGIALTFSSTIIVLKILYDKKQTEKLYGKIVIGILIIQDLIAAGILIFINSFSSGDFSSEIVISFLIKGTTLLALLVFLYKYVLPVLLRFFAKSQEFLFLFALGFGMGMASLFGILGFSVEIGALTAGVILSMFPYNHEIGSRMTPLRDFFLILFFIFLGAQIDITGIPDVIGNALLLSAFVIIGKPIIVFTLLKALRYKDNVSFHTAITMSQISEFSLIVVAAGVGFGLVSQELLSLVTLIGLITIAVSSYLITYSEKYIKYLRYFKVGSKKDSDTDSGGKDKYDALLLGCNRLGFQYLDTFMSAGMSFLVVDYDPNLIKELQKNKIPNIYGDADDAEFLDELNLSRFKIIASTIPDFDINFEILEKTRELNKDSIIILRSHDIREAMQLYKKGATYVVMPFFLGGKYASELINKHKFDVDSYQIEQKEHLKELDKKLSRGHVHPQVSRN